MMDDATAAPHAVRRSDDPSADEGSPRRDRVRDARSRDAHGPMDELAVLPVFFALGGKRVVLAGASERAVWKAELLHATGALVDIYAAAPCRELAPLMALCPRLRLHERAWAPGDLDGAALALLDTLDDGEAGAFRAAARVVGVPMNAIDNPAFCDFQFGAIVNRSPLVIGISTHGTAPVFGQTIRGRLEALLPLSLKIWAETARLWRERVVPLRLPFRGRRRFWEMFSERAMSTDGRGPAEEDFRAFLDAATHPAAQKGRVTLVGAGPGDPDLITLKALRALQSADVVLYDKLVAPAVVAMARREAQKIDVGKRGYLPSCRQDEITALMVALAGEGKHVVRLKGGDPMIFGRATEELDGVAAAGIAVTVVPGITAALGAASALQTSLTERSTARRLQFITAHAKDGRLPGDIDWRALCDPGATTVVYMGVRTMDALVAKLDEHGMAADMPAVLVERATCPDERRIAGTIAAMPALVRAAAPDGPCLLMIGQVFAGQVFAGQVFATQAATGADASTGQAIEVAEPVA